MSINRAIERNTIELLRCVLILFIVLIHTNLVADLHCENSLYGRIYAYLSEILWLSNSLFFAISGYLFFANTDFTYESYRSKIGRRVNSLIIPYFLWNTLVWFLYVAGSYFVPSLSNNEIKPIGETGLADVFNIYFSTYGEGLSSTPIDGPLWFLRNLIVLVFCTPIYYFVLRSHKYSVVLLALACLIPLPTAVSTSVIFFGLGCYLGIWKIDILRFCDKLYEGLFVFVSIIILERVVEIPSGLEFLSAFVKHCAGFLVMMALASKYVKKRQYKADNLLNKSLFFIFALHGIIARLLTKVTAVWITDSQDGWLGLAHLTNATISVMICIVVYKITYSISPSICKRLGSRN